MSAMKTLYYELLDNEEQQAEQFADMCYQAALDSEYRKQFYGLGEMMNEFSGVVRKLANE